MLLIINDKVAGAHSRLEYLLIETNCQTKLTIKLIFFRFLSINHWKNCTWIKETACKFSSKSVAAQLYWIDFMASFFWTFFPYQYIFKRSVRQRPLFLKVNKVGHEFGLAFVKEIVVITPLGSRMAGKALFYYCIVPSDFVLYEQIML